MKKLNLLLVTVGLITSVETFAGGGKWSGDPMEPLVSMPAMEIEFERTPFVFAYGGLIYSGLDVKQEKNSRFSDGALDTVGGMIELGAGYKFTKNIFSTIAYQGMFFDKKQMNNFYASINYEFDDEDLMNLYVGALFGGSTLTWDNDTHLVLIDKNLKSQSLMYGIQAGASKEIKENLSIVAKYQLIKYDHELDIRNNRSNVQQNFGQNILTGVQYAF